MKVALEGIQANIRIFDFWCMVYLVLLADILKLAVVLNCQVLVEMSVQSALCALQEACARLD